MKFEFYDDESKELTDKVIDGLWKQGVCMDDWDYMLFFEDGFETWMDESYSCREFNITMRPKNENVERLLTGCCRNTWYIVDDFMGRKGILGVAYHG